jgi:hypothetical protein
MDYLVVGFAVIISLLLLTNLLLLLVDNPKNNCSLREEDVEQVRNKMKKTATTKPHKVVVRLVPGGRFVWPEQGRVDQPQKEQNHEEEDKNPNGDDVGSEDTAAQTDLTQGKEGVCFGPWSESEGFPLFCDYQFPPHWTGLEETLQKTPDGRPIKRWVLPGRYGLGTYAMKRFVEDWITIDAVMHRYPEGPWPQFLGMPANRVVHAIRNRCLHLGLTEVPVCLLADNEKGATTERTTCPVHTRCVSVHQFRGRVSRVPLSPV